MKLTTTAVSGPLSSSDLVCENKEIKKHPNNLRKEYIYKQNKLTTAAESSPLSSDTCTRRKESHVRNAKIEAYVMFETHD